MSTRVGVGVVVQRADGRVLVGRRLTEDGRPLAIPGGKLDPGESVEACAVRELEEGLSDLVHDMRAVCVLAARSPRDADARAVAQPRRRGG